MVQGSKSTAMTLCRRQICDASLFSCRKVTRLPFGPLQRNGPKHPTHCSRNILPCAERKPPLIQGILQY
ncbi:hypothetical protein Y1Q_0014826 [Alligator mississippiensis]|uniref:Uncharacterized protein n=1 Tax=Alligator mississippiensis TaxID=8496 RepID=A0A151M223_ALLMI|nr:hypothetical protein Y1Q_0014826 [Alligator mississippiensis]